MPVAARLGRWDAAAACVDHDGFVCLRFEPVTSCSGTMCNLREYSLTPGETACEEVVASIHCGEGCANGACSSCPPAERDRFVRGEDADVCRSDDTLLEESVPDPSDPACPPGEVEVIRCEVGCADGACLCTDSDRRGSAIAGVDAFGRRDECEGNFLVERWASFQADQGCVPREERRTCTNGCSDGRCLPPAGAPPFVFTCLAFGLDRSQKTLEHQCTRGIAEFVDNTGIDELVDVRVRVETTRRAPVDGAVVNGTDYTSEIADVAGDLIVLLTSRILGDSGGTTTGSNGYALEGGRFVVVTAVAGLGENQTVPHELGHVFAIDEDSGSPRTGVCGVMQCRHICDELTFNTWSAANASNRCVNSYFEIDCPIGFGDETRWGHRVRVTGATAVHCYYGDDLVDPEFPPERDASGVVIRGFADVEREHLREWFRLWAARR